MGSGRYLSRLWGWAIGAVATLLVCAALLAGWFERLDGYNLDLHFRHCNTLQADPRIVLIDIDDTTLSVMPDWPWPRRVFADLVRTLGEFEPKSIVLDIVFDLPSSSHRDVQGEYSLSPDDQTLADALADAGNVYLAMLAELAGSCDAPCAQPDINRIAAREFLHRNELGSLGSFLAEAAPDVPVEAITPDIEKLRRAFLTEGALNSIMKHSSFPKSAPRVEQVFVVNEVPPFKPLADAAAGTGLVSFRRQGGMSVVRSLPMFAECYGRSLPQLGLLSACPSVFAKGSVVRLDLEADHWNIADDSRTFRLPVDRSLQTLIHWVAPEGGMDWRATFAHRPAARVLEISENRRAMEENRTRLRVATAELVRVRHADTPAAFDDYVKLINQRIESARSEPRASARATSSDDARSAEIEDESVEWLERAWGLWEKETPRNEEETVERDRIKRLYERFGEGQYAALLDAANRKLETRNVELIRALAPQLKDKIVLVGYTATAMADMVPTPVDPAMPGVMVHANVVNMFLQNRFASGAEAPVNLLLMLASGALTTVAAVRGRTRVSVAALLLVASGLIAVGAFLFYEWTYHIAALPTAVGVCFVWACVTVYRQTSDERSRRKLQRALAQYTSPAVAARIAEQARADTLAPRTARVSCFFSDLSGFTALSERLGPQKTREALDPYLRDVSAVIMAQGGMVNKFLGDGVFAFFNAPILPCRNHAAAACESALRVAAGLRGRVGGPNLAIRIGLSTGDVFVGDYGSEQKLDYTCIGDTVNVAQRLERANKFLGTTILVDDATRQSAGDAFVFRSLGRLAVAGRANPVAAHELLARSPADPTLADRIARFQEAIRFFQTCQWAQCLSILAEYCKANPSDQSAACYEDAARRLQAAPPSPGWNGAIDVTAL